MNGPAEGPSLCGPHGAIGGRVAADESLAAPSQVEVIRRQATNMQLTTPVHRLTQPLPSAVPPLPPDFSRCAGTSTAQQCRSRGSFWKSYA